MLSPLEFFGLVAAGLIIGLQVSHWRAKEMANRVAKLYCDRAGLQFLDGTVALEFWRPVLARGGLRLRRTYRFEYTTQAVDRRRGVLIFLSQDVESFLLQEDSSLEM